MTYTSRRNRIHVAVEVSSAASSPNHSPADFSHMPFDVPHVFSASCISFPAGGPRRLLPVASGLTSFIHVLLVEPRSSGAFAFSCCHKLLKLVVGSPTDSKAETTFLTWLAVRLCWVSTTRKATRLSRHCRGALSQPPWTLDIAIIACFCRTS